VRPNRVLLQSPQATAHMVISWTDRSIDPLTDTTDRAFQFQSGAALGYRQLRLTRVRFQGRPAVDWEYQYANDVERAHGRDITVAGRHHGYVLSFQTSQSDWKRHQPILLQIRQSFTLR
jgi:hypothetical protein